MEEWYRKRVNENDLKIAKAQLWPNIGIDLSTNYDSNEFLYNNYWAAAGVRVSLNLFKLLQLPALNAQQESQTKTDDMRRLALSMAILTQVRVGVLRYRLSRSGSRIRRRKPARRHEPARLCPRRAQDVVRLGARSDPRRRAAICCRAMSAKPRIPTRRPRGGGSTTRSAST